MSSYCRRKGPGTEPSFVSCSRRKLSERPRCQFASSEEIRRGRGESDGGWDSSQSVFIDQRDREAVHSICPRRRRKDERRRNCTSGGYQVNLPTGSQLTCWRGWTFFGRFTFFLIDGSVASPDRHIGWLLLLNFDQLLQHRLRDTSRNNRGSHQSLYKESHD